MRRSLRTWLSLGLATLVALAVLSVTVVVLGVLVPSLNAKVEAQSRTLSQAAATQINSFLESFSSQMSGLCDEIAALPALDTAELRTIVDTIAHAEKGIDSLYVIDEDDRVLEVGLPMKHRFFRPELRAQGTRNRA